MSYVPDEYDLERAHELERRLDRDMEREPYAFARRSGRRRPRSFLVLVANMNNPRTREEAA